MNTKKINTLLTYVIVSVFLAVVGVLTISVLVGEDLLTPHQAETLVLAGLIFIYIVTNEETTKVTEKKK